MSYKGKYVVSANLKGEVRSQYGSKIGGSL